MPLAHSSRIDGSGNCTVVKEVVAVTLQPDLLRPSQTGICSGRQDTAPYAWGNEVVRGEVAPGAEKVSHLPDVQGTAQRHRQLKSINDGVQQKH
ncbi:hypothetical protein ACHWQZ_G007277 [Mnemiopsis leidyi]